MAWCGPAAPDSRSVPCLRTPRTGPTCSFERWPRGPAAGRSFSTAPSRTEPPRSWPLDIGSHPCSRRLGCTGDLCQTSRYPESMGSPRSNSAEPKRRHALTAIIGRSERVSLGWRGVDTRQRTRPATLSYPVRETPNAHVEHGRAERLTHLRTRACRDDEGHHTENEGEGGHQDRPEAQPGCLDDGLDRALSTLLGLLCELDDEDGVLGREPD